MKIKNLLIIFLINNITIHFIKTAVFIPTTVRAKTSYYTTKAAENVLGQPLTTKLRGHLKTGLEWWNWYSNSMIHATPQEIKMHGLWYGFKSGTSRSLYGEDPLKELHRYYQTAKKNWKKTLSDQDLEKYHKVIENYNRAHINYYLAHDEESKEAAEKDLLHAQTQLILSIKEHNEKIYLAKGEGKSSKQENTIHKLPLVPSVQRKKDEFLLQQRQHLTELEERKSLTKKPMFIDRR